MTTDNPPPEPLSTPTPEVAGSSEPEPPTSSLDTFSLESPPPVVASDPTTTDDINLMLTTSIERPEPDPMLGSADSIRLDIGVQLTPSPTFTAASSLDDRPSSTSDGIASNTRRPPYSWTTLLLASYSSAVTMALVWVLMTNRGFRKTDAAATPPPPAAIDWERKDAAAAPSHVHAPTQSDVRTTKLGAPLIVGDLEITPLQVRFRDVNLVRIVDPKATGRRLVADCLVLTLRLMNRSSDHRLTPLELSTVRETGDAIDGSFIESATGERIGMFELAMESEWSIENQSFPSVKPGRTEDVILVSEPIHDRRLASPLVWRITIQTDAGESEEIGVRFDRQEIGESRP